jgi:alpha-D-ribose 1-methylphosphonate 5-triphosphate synthase subunit PhnG
MSEITRSPAQARAEAMRLLSCSKPEELSGPIQSHWSQLETRMVRAPETGLVMLRGRTGGDGQPFNLGEATVSRAVIELSTGERGYGQLLGRNRDHAALAATVEALNQRDPDRAEVERLILAPIRERLAAEAQRQRAETAATKVDFFTLVRAEG